MNLRTYHAGGTALRRHARQVPSRVARSAPRSVARAVSTPMAAPLAAPPRQDDAVALLSGSSMRFMEGGLAVVAIATAVLLGVGR